ncbi:phage terminase large subunit [Acetobacter senegalensis]|uniref:phage terminase large subunit n=1 Tax=Acetobacter senegalensis TaxID=446692 RepID=UPI0038D01CAF
MMNSVPLHRQVSQNAQAELKNRSHARQNLLDFTRYTMPGYQSGVHHHLLCQKLDAVERGTITRLMVFMPPRHGKSELVSRRFPAWYLGRHPHKQVISASYGATLAQDFGRDVRNLVASRRFHALFPSVTLAADSAARDVWHTNAGGVYAAMGIGGGLTGKGAHLAIVDDPIKDRQEAESPTRRAAVWDWYRAVLRTRLMPGGAIVLVMTRWSPDDLAGRLLDDMQNNTGEAWDVLSLPALAGPQDALGRPIGASLWPQAFPAEDLAHIRLAIGAREWSALYQQNPTPAEGALFKTAFISVVDAIPIGSFPTQPDPTHPARPFTTDRAPAPMSGKATVRRWDLAATRASTRPNADWTVGVKMMRLSDGRFCVADVARLRGDPAQVEAAILATAAQDGPQTEIILPQDPGQAGVAQARYLTGKLAGYRVRTVRESGDKATRAAPFAAQVNAGNVLALRAAWTPAFLEELAAFPAAAHDDQVDAAAGAFTALTETTPLPSFNRTFLARI